MTGIKAFIRTGKRDKGANIRFRLTDGRSVQLFHKSELSVLPDLWDEKREQYKAKCIVKPDERARLNSAVAKRKELILSIYSTTPDLTSEKLEQLIDERLHPERYERAGANFFETMELYLTKKKLSDSREKNTRVLIRALQRYELFKAAYGGKPFTLSLDKVNADTIEDIESFLRNEHALAEEYPSIYKAIPASINPRHKKTNPQARGNNTICSMFNKLRAFFNWCNEQGITTNHPFDKYNGVKSEKYGTPIYITLEERNQIADFDLSAHPQLAVQRDIFIFQCLIGCRVSDLMGLTGDSIISDKVEYIPHKTKDERPETVVVPLNERAKALVKKYKGVDAKSRLMPFISPQKYNDDIKDIFRLCGITRTVTVLNPTTSKEEKRPINEVASSHMARRTFVGNLYKQVKDPNLVGSLSGHKVGSKAFARYRDIDIDMKKELVNLID
jgi:integrase